MRSGAAARLGHCQNGPADFKTFPARLWKWGQRSAPAHLTKCTPIFKNVRGTSCNRHVAAIAQIKKIRKCTQARDSQQQCVWWCGLTIAGLYQSISIWSKTPSGPVAPPNPCRPYTCPETASVAVLPRLSVGSLL